ncbi:MAG: methylmalonyl-CoA epimerase [Candidatus Zixiibacteriota bacterium]
MNPVTDKHSDSLVSHIGIAVSDLERSIPTYALLTGIRDPHIEDVPDQKVRVAIFDRPSAFGGRIELVAATSPDSPIARFIAKHGEGLHHVCICVENIERRLAELRSAGVKLIDESPRLGAQGAKIAFVHPSSIGGVLIELQEISKTRR